MAEGHLHEPAPRNGLRVFLVSVVPWPWQLPFGSFLVTIPWSWPFLSGRSSLAICLWPIGSLAFATPYWWVFSITSVVLEAPQMHQSSRGADESVMGQWAYVRQPLLPPVVL